MADRSQGRPRSSIVRQEGHKRPQNDDPRQPGSAQLGGGFRASSLVAICSASTSRLESRRPRSGPLSSISSRCGASEHVSGQAPGRIGLGTIPNSHSPTVPPTSRCTPQPTSATKPRLIPGLDVSDLHRHDGSVTLGSAATFPVAAYRPGVEHAFGWRSARPRALAGGPRVQIRYT